MGSGKHGRWSFAAIGAYVVAFLLIGAGPLRAAPENPCCADSGCCGGHQGQACRLDYGANGTVSDAITGDPIAGATVDVLDLAPVTTAADGTFSLAGSRSDVCGLDYFYTFSATAPGYQPYQLTVYTTAVRPTLQVQLTPLSHVGHTISGYVAESSGCSGRMRGVTVTLNPLGLSTQTSLGPDGGRFQFDGVPPGTYRLTVDPSCNPFGCWDAHSVTVTDSDAEVNICISEELGLVEVNVSGEEAAPGESFEVETRLRSQGNQVYRVAHTIAFGDTPIQATVGGAPDCTVNPETGADTSSFEFEPEGCSGDGCTALRAVVESTDRPLTDGILYTCNAEMTSEFSSSCEHQLLCEDLSAASGGGQLLESLCTHGTAIAAYRNPEVTFTFDIEPEQPEAGDHVTLTVSPRLEGFGGLPTYTLSGSAPYFAGDTSPIHRSQFDGVVSYELDAAFGGRAELVMSVTFETHYGCPGNEYFQFTLAHSPPFVVDVVGPPPPATPTFTETILPTLTPQTPTPTPCHFAPTPPQCPLGKEPDCVSLPCIVGCGCKQCPACPSGQMYSGEINRCDCVPIPVDATMSPTPTSTSTPTPTPTNTPCAQSTPPLCPTDTHLECNGSPCNFVCTCVADTRLPPTPTQPNQIASGNGGGNGCAVSASDSDSASAFFLAPLVLLIVMRRRFRTPMLRRSISCEPSYWEGEAPAEPPSTGPSGSAGASPSRNNGPSAVACGGCRLPTRWDR